MPSQLAVARIRRVGSTRSNAFSIPVRPHFHAQEIIDEETKTIVEEIARLSIFAGNEPWLSMRYRCYWLN